jgi:N-dimethylarginine dimethylaminohydrolase
VEYLTPVPELVDMDFAANGDFTADGRAYIASFTYRERRAEAQSFQTCSPPTDSTPTVRPPATRARATSPSAFDADNRELLAEQFPDSIIVSEDEAAILPLNSVSDGRNVVVAIDTLQYRRALTAAGYRPIPVDLSELLKSGGSVKWINQELRH